MRTPIKKPLSKRGLVKQTHSNSKTKTKQFIVRMGINGTIPLALADWLIKPLELSHE